MSDEDDFAFAYFVNGLAELGRSHLHFPLSELLNSAHVLELSDVDFVVLHSADSVLQSCEAHQH